MTTYNNGVEFCDLSAFDKERVNQGILEPDCDETQEKEMSNQISAIIEILKAHPNLNVLHCDVECGFSPCSEPVIEKVIMEFIVEEDGSFRDMNHLARYNKEMIDQLEQAIAEFPLRDLGKEWEDMNKENLQIAETQIDDYSRNMWLNMAGSKEKYLRDCLNYNNRKVEMLRRLALIEPSIVFYGT